MKEGYKFALIIDDKYLTEKPNSALLDMFKYIIFTDKKEITGEMKNLRNVIIMD